MSGLFTRAVQTPILSYRVLYLHKRQKSKKRLSPHIF